MSAPTELHNRLAPEIVSRIIRETLAAGGDSVDVMVLTESVVLGALLACVKIGGDERALDVMFDGLRDRLSAKLAEARLTSISARGSA